MGHKKGQLTRGMGVKRVVLCDITFLLNYFDETKRDLIVQRADVFPPGIYANSDNSILLAAFGEGP